MQKTFYIVYIFFISAIQTVCAAEASEKVIWDMPTAYSIHNFHTKNIVSFSNQINRITNGDFQITVHAGASLFTAPNILRVVRGKQVQIGEILMTLLANQNSAYSLDDIPFFATSYKDASKLSELQRPYIEKILAEQGMIYLFSVPWPPQGLFTYKPIESLDDLRGLNFRAYSKQTARLSELLGSRPITIQAAEVSQALAIGKINALFASSQSGVDYKVWETLKYYYDVRSWLPKNMVVVNEEAFKSLNSDNQEILLNAAKEAQLEGWKNSEKITEEANHILIKNGIQVRKLNPELEKRLKDLALTMLEEWLASANNESKSIANEFYQQ